MNEELITDIDALYQNSPVTSAMGDIAIGMANHDSALLGDAISRLGLSMGV